MGSMGCSLCCPLSCCLAEGSNRGTQGSMAGDTINVWGVWRSLQGVATASNPLLPREPRRAALGLFMAPLAAGLLGFAGCSPGSLIPPIIYLIQTLCRAAIIVSELPHCLTINISSRVPGTRLCRSRPHRAAHALSRTPAATPDMPAQGVRAAGCDTPGLAQPGHHRPPSALSLERCQGGGRSRG